MHIHSSQFLSTSHHSFNSVLRSLEAASPSPEVAVGTGSIFGNSPEFVSSIAFLSCEPKGRNIIKYQRENIFQIPVNYLRLNKKSFKLGNYNGTYLLLYKIVLRKVKFYEKHDRQMLNM